MTGTEIRETVFQFLVDDTNIDETQELALLNIAYDRVNAMRDWLFLRKSQSSQTISSTTTYAQPSDFMYLIKAQTVDSASSVNNMRIVPFDLRLEFNTSERTAYMDILNTNLVFTTAPVADVGSTLYWTYQYQPAQLTNSTSPVFPRQFHALLGYEMARMYFYNDQAEKDRSWNKEMAAEYNLMLKQMKDWDIQLSLKLEGEWLPDQWLPETA